MGMKGVRTDSAYVRTESADEANRFIKLVQGKTPIGLPSPVKVSLVVPPPNGLKPLKQAEAIEAGIGAREKVTGDFAKYALPHQSDETYQAIRAFITENDLPPAYRNVLRMLTDCDARTVCKMKFDAALNPSGGFQTEHQRLHSSHAKVHVLLETLQVFDEEVFKLARIHLPPAATGFPAPIAATTTIRPPVLFGGPGNCFWPPVAPAVYSWPAIPAAVMSAAVVQQHWQFPTSEQNIMQSGSA